MNPKVSLLILFVAVYFSKQLNAKEKVDSIYDEKMEHYQTFGSIPVPLPFEKLGKIGNDFKSYNLWALKGINGDKENSREFISILKELIFIKQLKNETSKHGFFNLIYDVDLIFPFGQTDSSLKLKIVEHQEKDGILDSFKISLAEDSIVIKQFDLSIKLRESKDKQSFIDFSITFKLRKIFDMFFSLTKYRYNVEWRILTGISNLKDYSLSMSSHEEVKEPQEEKQ